MDSQTEKSKPTKDKNHKPWFGRFTRRTAAIIFVASTAIAGLGEINARSKNPILPDAGSLTLNWRNFPDDSDNSERARDIREEYTKDVLSLITEDSILKLSTHLDIYLQDSKNPGVEVNRVQESNGETAYSVLWDNENRQLKFSTLTEAIEVGVLPYYHQNRTVDSRPAIYAFISGAGLETIARDAGINLSANPSDLQNLVMGLPRDSIKNVENNTYISLSFDSEYPNQMSANVQGIFLLSPSAVEQPHNVMMSMNANQYGYFDTLTIDDSITTPPTNEYSYNFEEVGNNLDEYMQNLGKLANTVLPQHFSYLNPNLPRL